jgi:hypothetical protein
LKYRWRIYGDGVVMDADKATAPATSVDTVLASHPHRHRPASAVRVRSEWLRSATNGRSTFEFTGCRRQSSETTSYTAALGILNRILWDNSAEPGRNGSTSSKGTKPSLTYRRMADDCPLATPRCTERASSDAAHATIVRNRRRAIPRPRNSGFTHIWYKWTIVLSDLSTLPQVNPAAVVPTCPINGMSSPELHPP